MSEEDSGVLMEEGIYLDPVLLFAVDLFAFHADGDHGSEFGDSGDGLDNQQSPFLDALRQGAGGEENLKFSHFHAVGKPEIHHAMADTLALKTKPHGIANHAALAFRSAAATFSSIGGVQTA